MATSTASRTTLPKRVLPMLADSSAPFDDPDFRFDVKWDGVRCLAAVDGTVRLWGREGADYSGRYPELDGLRRLPRGTMLDGELVAVRNGRPDFHALMSRHAMRPRVALRFVEPVAYIAFDVLYHRGRSVMEWPLRDRRQLLESLPKIPNVFVCDGLVGEGRRFFKAALEVGHEGIVAKRLTSTYTPNRRSWLKIKEHLQLACVVIGYRLGAEGLSALLLASLFEGELRYAGLVELGIRQADLKQLEAIRRKSPAVPCSLSARWVEPKKFCKVQFAGWRPAAWRDAVFLGWDESSGG